MSTFNHSTIAQTLKKQRSANKVSFKAGALVSATVIVLENLTEQSAKFPPKWVSKGTPPDVRMVAVVIDCEETINQLNKTCKVPVTQLIIPKFVKGSKSYEVDPKAPGIVLNDGNVITLKSFNAKDFKIKAGDKLSLFSITNKEYVSKKRVDGIETGEEEIKESLEFGGVKLLGRNHLRDVAAQGIFPFPNSPEDTFTYIINNIRMVKDDSLREEKYDVGTCFGVCVKAGKFLKKNQETSTQYSFLICEIHETSIQTENGEELTKRVNVEVHCDLYDAELKSLDLVTGIKILESHNIPFVPVLKFDGDKTSELKLQTNEDDDKVVVGCKAIAVEWHLKKYLKQQELVDFETAITFAENERNKYGSYDSDATSPIQNLARCSPVIYKEILKTKDDWDVRALYAGYKESTTIDNVIKGFCVNKGYAEYPQLESKYYKALNDESVLEIYVIKKSNKRKRE
jgi:hypothetical protein